jgi:hypothetical protein
MPTSSSSPPAVRAAFEALIDYAGLFPPARLEMGPAAAEYLEHSLGAQAWMLGRFIVPLSRVDDLLNALPSAAASIPVSLIATAAELPRVAQLRATQTRLRIEVLETPLERLQRDRDTYDAAIGQFAAAAAHAGLSDLPAFVELPRDARWAGELSGATFALRRHRLGAKLRCGGVTADAFPSPDDVAFFLEATLGEYRVPMKATAGLHHPVRRPDPATGATMHGFLNLLVAAALARRGAQTSEIAGVLSCEDADRFGFHDDALHFGGVRIGHEELAAVRRDGFVSYGSCSFNEPVSDLRDLGVLS